MSHKSINVYCIRQPSVQHKRSALLTQLSSIEEQYFLQHCQLPKPDDCPEHDDIMTQIKHINKLLSLEHNRLNSKIMCYVSIVCFLHMNTQSVLTYYGMFINLVWYSTLISVSVSLCLSFSLTHTHTYHSTYM